MEFKRGQALHSKVVVSAVLAGMITLGTGTSTFAAETTTVSAAAASSIFSDVKTGYWAEKHIYKLAGQDILLGNNGLFRPGDAVTQQEAITMAIRFLNKENQLSSASPTAVPAKIQVNNYYKSYAALAFQLKLLDAAEESSVDVGKDTWGSKKATREWIAKLLVRALGKDAEAKSAASTATGFADNNKISANAKGYVNVAVSLDLTKGVDGNRFDPLGQVTRAQLATFFSRGEALTNNVYSNVTEGYVVQNAGGKLTLNVSGSKVTFNVPASTPYFSKTSETRAAADDVKLYSKVSVIGKNGTASYIEIVDPTQQVESIQGSFQRLASGNKLWMLVNDNYESYTYDSDTVFTDQNGNVIKPEALTQNSLIELSRETFTSDKKPVSVTVKSGIVNKSDTGTVQSVDTVNKTITFKSASGITDTFKLDDLSVIKYQNELLALSELKAGAAVKYTIKNSVIASVEVTQGVERTVRGVLYSIGQDNKTLTYQKEGGGLEVKFLSDKPEIVVTGMASASLSDLIADPTAGDSLQLTLNGQDQITKVEVLNRQSKQLNGVTVSSYDAKNRILTVLDSNKQAFAVTLNDKTKLDYNTPSPTLAGVEKLLTEGKKVNLTFISSGFGARALSLQVMYKYEGTISTLDNTGRKVTLLLADGTTVTLPYVNLSPAVEYYGKAGATISDLKYGDRVTAILSDDQNTVQTLLVQKVQQFEIVSVDAALNRIRVQSGGVTSDIDLSKVTLTGDSGQTIKTADLAAKGLVNISFSGTTPTSLQSVKLVVGEVLSVDANAKVLMIKDYTGKTQSVNAGGNVTVTKNGVTGSTIASLAAGDRLEMRNDIDGSLILKALTSQAKQFWTYDVTNKQVYVKRASTADDNYRLDLAPNVYIHQGDTTLSVQSLKENDNIIVYFNNNVVVEIQKQ
ncbi:S-layer homology domain-containing protein [Paenibacillus sp. JX-17]|uniref:S-layer homology domain-containing protein n=1 Tax=Paenibacillus lacisoli TaxID=3064525 RepID=A0ABT9CAG3_9BACL|nr:S-layer homology domain-containing protein [Paenibacillus sp. JX-17]MDO7905007.1 S-layer homology domain-containing protein [Paenibacillus sp. JX-17]